MTPQEAADLLRAHNEWRRGGDDPPTEPTALGQAIEIAIAALEGGQHAG